MGTMTLSFRKSTGLFCFFHLHLAFAGGLLLFVSLLSSHIQSGNCASIQTSPWGWGNGTTASSSVAAEESAAPINDDQEFLTDSVFGSMLAANGPKTIGYDSFQPKKTCGAIIYGNCVPPNPGASKRPCDFKNRCSHTQ